MTARRALDYVQLLAEAKQRVRSSPLWHRFIEHTPLKNDIAVWMADFAAEQTDGRQAGERDPGQERLTVDIRNPITDTEWQIAVTLAQAALMLESARQYGLIVGGPTIHVERALLLIEIGATKGITPNATALDEAVLAIVASTGAHS